MMIPQELRMGNYVDYDDVIVEVKSINNNFILTKLFSSLDYKDLEPIELTEEWLVKLGFKVFYESDFQKKYDKDYSDLHIQARKVDNGYGIKINLNVYYRGEPIGKQLSEHVHQLQNLYFALTGQELTIKE